MSVLKAEFSQQQLTVSEVKANDQEEEEDYISIHTIFTASTNEMRDNILLI